MSAVHLRAWGAYVPARRLPRSEMAALWDGPAVPGERSVAGPDEDTVTMAVEAALDCLAGLDPAEVDAVYFASTTAPYGEHQAAATVVAVLGARRDVVTAAVTDTLRAGTTALRMAADAVAAGTARRVLVVAADARLGEPDSLWEQVLGDAAAAVLVGTDGPVAIRETAAVAQEFLGPWRRSDEAILRSFEGKYETEYGVRRPLVEAAEAVLAKAGLGSADVDRFVLAAPDPRSARQAGAPLGTDSGEPHDELFMQVGYTGAAHPLLCLGTVLERAAAGERVLLAAHGEGADAFLLDVVADPGAAPAPGRRGVAGSLARRRPARYGDYLKSRGLLHRLPVDRRASPVTYTRDVPRELPLTGTRCGACGLVQYPGGRVCDGCGAYRTQAEVALARRGRVFTSTLDHLDQNCYLTDPVPRAVVDLDGGGRIFCDLTDCDPDVVGPGLAVELAFRKVHDGGGYRNYYWKCRPAEVQ